MRRTIGAPAKLLTCERMDDLMKFPITLEALLAAKVGALDADFQTCWTLQCRLFATFRRLAFLISGRHDLLRLRFFFLSAINRIKCKEIPIFLS